MRTEDKKERKRKGKEFKHYAKSILSLEENRNDQQLWLTFAECNRKLGVYSKMILSLVTIVRSQAIIG